MRKPRQSGGRSLALGHRKPRGLGYERRAEILAVAKELFVKHGYEAVSTRQLAERVGLSQTGLYVYFNSKDAILDELRRSTFERLGQRLRDEMSTSVRGRALLRRLLRGYIEFALENPDEYQLTFMVSHASLKKVEPKDASRTVGEQGPGMQAFHAFREQVAKLIDAGALRKVDASAATQALWSATHGLATLLITWPSFPWAAHEVLIDTLVETLVKGLQTPPRRP